MSLLKNPRITWVLAISMLLGWSDIANSRGGGGGGGGRGGARPSMGKVGGGGGRPSMSRPSGGSRPSRPPVSRPSVQRPSMGSASRPQMPSRPNIASRPSGGGFSPSGGRPNVSRPTTRPGGAVVANRPSVKLPSNVGPVNRPSLPGGGIERPTTLPGTADRPGLGHVNRPTTLPGTIYRPGIGGNRPGDRPGIASRPGDRPIIGGGNRPNRPGVGNGNINIGNDINIGSGNIVANRPNWDRPNWNRPDWGWGNGGWAGNWHDHCIDHHHHWYNGCWNGYWKSNWYAPLAWGAVGWGLGTWTSGWGYGTSYYNPYCVEPVAVAAAPYDYSQPIVVNNYIAADEATTDDTASPAPASPESEAGLKLFDSGLAQFKAGDYQAALQKLDAALAKLPGDPVVHEVRALTLFALGDYQSAAAALNSFLSSAPGMDWTTMSSLYGNADDYQAQLRKLEQFCKSNGNDASAYFVLAYHYLAIGSKDAAINALQVVVRNQPKDYTAKRMLDALAPAQSSTPTPEVSAVARARGAPETDLVGRWRTTAGTTTIDLSITEDSKFTWKAVPNGKPAVELTGQLATTGDSLVLETADQGAMSGTVEALGPNEWSFALSGAPKSDPGLRFERAVKN